MSISKIKINEYNEASITLDSYNEIDKIEFKKFLELDCNSFLKCEFENGQNFSLYYDCDGYITLRSFLKNVIDRKEAVLFLRSLTAAFVQAEAYDLNPNHIMLSIDGVFYDAANQEVGCIYLPVKVNQPPQKSLRLFLKEILVNILYNEEDNMEWLGNVIRYINLNKSLSYKEFYEFLDLQLDQETESILNAQTQEFEDISIVPPAENEETELDDMSSEMLVTEKNDLEENDLSSETEEFSLQKHLGENNEVPDLTDEEISLMAVVNDGTDSEKNESVEDMPQSLEAFSQKIKPENFLDSDEKEEITEIPEILNETESNVEIPEVDEKLEQMIDIVNLEKAVEMEDEIPVENLEHIEGIEKIEADEYVENIENAVLIRRKNQNIFYLNQEKADIGKSKECKICISDNPVISRRHATIYCEGIDYVIIDNGSTNHTFINGIVLQPNQEKVLNSGDRIILGNEEFVFKIQ